MAPRVARDRACAELPVDKCHVRMVHGVLRPTQAGTTESACPVAV
jgi:hypothetical protein